MSWPWNQSTRQTFGVDRRSLIIKFVQFAGEGDTRTEEQRTTAFRFVLIGEEPYNDRKHHLVAERLGRDATGELAWLPATLNTRLTDTLLYWTMRALLEHRVTAGGIAGTVREQLSPNGFDLEYVFTPAREQS